MDRNTTYRLGRSGVIESIAVFYQLWLANSKKELGRSSALQIARHINLDGAPRILEIGPGIGTVSAAHLCALKMDLTLFDLWGYYKQWALMKGRNPSLKVVIGDANTPLPFGDGSFDCCIHMGAICYLSDPVAALNEIFRILAPGGKLIISNVKNAGNLAFENGLLDISNMPTLWSNSDLKQAIEAAGFKIEETKEYGISPPRFAKAYRIFTLFFHYHGWIYDYLISKHPGNYSMTGAVASKPV